MRILQRGFTMIELTVSLLLGLLVVGAAGSIFLSNHRVYGSTEAINRIQENQRSAFEMLARDIREAGTNPCIRFTTAVRPIMGMTTASPSATFWNEYTNGVAGGTSDITLYAGVATVYNVTLHKRPTDAITVDRATADLAGGQPVMICNTDYAIAIAATDLTSGGTTIGHDVPLNCGKSLTPSPDSSKCAQTAAGPGYCFWLGAGVTPTAADVTACPGGIGRSPAYVVVPTSARWALAANGSLTRTVGGVTSEIAEGVSGLNFTYKVGNAAGYVAASAVTDWSTVTAVHAQMTFAAVGGGALSDTQVKGTDGAALSRRLDDYIVLRNHQDIQ